MKFSKSLLFGACLFFGPLSALNASPRLVVVVVVDQMRADYIDRYSREYFGGLHRLAEEGARFTEARHGHIPTETAPGHAALLTGCFPGQHGIVGNEWWDRSAGAEVNSVQDAEFGISPRALQCPTLGDALRSASPKSKLVSITGKDRSAVLMGGHKPNLVLWCDASAGQFVSSKYYGRLPDWVSDWNEKYGIPVEQRAGLKSTPLLDALTLELARRAIEEEHLGAGEAADLLTIGLSATDYTGHLKGPDSLEMHSQLVALDRDLGYFLAYLDQRFGAGNYTLALSADHGVLPVPESAAGKTMNAVRLNVDSFLGEVEAGLRAKFSPSQAPWKKGSLTFESMNNIYVNKSLAKDLGVEYSAVLKETAALLAKNPNIAQVFLAADLAPGGNASGPYADIFRRSFYGPRSGDILVLLKPGVYPSDSATGTGHGLPYDYDTRVPLIFMGAGIRPGRYDQAVLAEDLSPTLGRILGLDFPPHDPSRVLSEVLLANSPAPRK